MGAKRSDTALTDSTTPKFFAAVTLAPTLGSSTNTTSPSCSCAYAVMPTRTRSPSCLAHSCSRVYLRSLGTLAMLSSTRLFHLGGIEGCPRDLGPLALAANLDLDGAADGCQGRLDVRDPDVLVDRGAIRARGDDADRATVFPHRIAVARDGLFDHLDADQAPPHAFGADLLERLAPDELALRRLDDPAQASLERVRRVVDVVAVQGVLHLEPQSVARPEPDRRDAVGAPGGPERLP